MSINSSLIRAVCSLIAGSAMSGLVLADVEAGVAESRDAEENAFLQACTPSVLQAAAEAGGTGIAVGNIANWMTGAELENGARYFPSTEQMPAHCQVSGKYVTNPETGKTANFVATFPRDWNGKYLQYGCFGTCGFIALNDATSPVVDIIAQGRPGDSLRKGYASFGTDAGHEGRESAAWAVEEDGGVDQDAIDDFLYRATAVLAEEGRAFTEAFYEQVEGNSRPVQRAYFTGCSGGGRDALVAASYFSEQFDGIIAGSPAGDFGGLAFHSAAIEKAIGRSDSAAVSSEQVALINSLVDQQCDGLDGVVDGLIQNPAACNFVPERDLPRCDAENVDRLCFTAEQLETVSVFISAVTDENGVLVQPGYSISNLMMSGLEDRIKDVIKVFAFNNAPAFDLQAVIELQEQEGPGGTFYRAVVPSEVVATVRSALQKGIGTDPQKLSNLVDTGGKLMIWHDLSDQLLTPYTSINLYKRLAESHGGYDALKEQVRLFGLPGTVHCSGGMGGVGPNSFDALSALENWVENDVAPDALVATYYPGTPIGGKNFSAPPGRTMPLCAFPARAHYQGHGLVEDAENWRCDVATDAMLETGESGRRAGVME